MKFGPPFKWMLRRSAPRLEVLLDRGTIYILPTRQGLFFGVILVLMLLGSVNYTLSLGFALTFLLGAMAMVSVLHTYRNLAGIKVAPRPSKPVFAGETATFVVRLHCAAGRRSDSVGLEFGAKVNYFDIPQGNSVDVEFSTKSETRGRLRPGRFTVSTTYPLGLFRAWSYVELESSVLVYPRPEAPHSTQPMPVESMRERGKSSVSGQNDFSGLRTYREGDALRHVAWKALAREQGMKTKEFASPVQQERLWLDWDSLEGAPPESRLSMLTQMVLDADLARRDYGLRLPGKTIAIGAGKAQRERCLEALALWGIES